MKNRIPWHFIAVTLLLINMVPVSLFAGDGDPEILTIVDGDDWWLPPEVHPNPGTGFGWVNDAWVQRWTDRYPVQQGGMFFSEYIYFNWAEVNPAPGEYDWDVIDREIEKISRTPNMGFVLWPRVYARSNVMDRKLHGRGGYDGDPEIPRWLEEQGKVRFMPEGTVLAWEKGSGYLPAFRDFLMALSDRYKAHPLFGWVECRYIDPVYGEGTFRVGVDAFERAERISGMSPAVLERYLKEYFDIWAEAFAGHERKVVVANWEPKLGQFSNDYRDACEHIWRYAAQLGFGGRDGQVESWYRYTTSGYGITVDDNGYMLLDDDFPPIRDGVIWHTENENVLLNSGKFGPDSQAGYRWFTSNLRLLQMRRNWSLLVYLEPGKDGGGAALMWPQLTRYVQLSLGKTINNSPDAWCWLREGYKRDSRERKGYTLKNFERWLIQRDIGPDGVTVPAAKVDISLLGQTSSEPFEFQARSTNSAEGQNSIYFQVDPRWFGDKAQSVRMFVTYFDGPDAVFDVEYMSSDGVQRTPEIDTRNSGSWRTISYRIPELAAGGSMSGGMDFRVRSTGGKDVHVRMVRIVKVRF